VRTFRIVHSRFTKKGGASAAAKLANENHLVQFVRREEAA
jgi:hypothetical protein